VLSADNDAAPEASLAENFHRLAMNPADEAQAFAALVEGGAGSGKTLLAVTFAERLRAEGARCLGLNGAEIVFNPSATVAGLSQYLWKIEQPAHAVANGYWMGCINRVGTEAPWNIGKFYGSSYFVNPRGETVAQAFVRMYRLQRACEVQLAAQATGAALGDALTPFLAPGVAQQRSPGCAGSARAR
jgi:hypothetical protein